MKCRAWMAVALGYAVALAGLRAQAVDAIAITDVTVIDVASSERRPGQTVVIVGDRILAVGDVEGAVVPEGAVAVDGRGKFLIPGLWDMHVHAVTSPSFPELFVANGVTGVREMFGWMPMANLREQIERGSRVGPTIVATGRIVDGKRPFWPNSIAVGTADEGRAAVARLAEEGAAFVKVYTRLSKPAYDAIMAEAAARDLPVDGHVPSSVSARYAAAAGQRCIEHLTGVLEASSGDEAQWRKRSGADRDRGLIGTRDPELAQALYGAFVEHGTWHCPTLTVLRSIAHLDDEDFVADDRVRYLPGFWKVTWDPKRDRRFEGRNADDWAAAKERYRASLVVVREMHEAGVRLVAGTDTANPYCLPGFSLHDELELLVEAGLSPGDALRTATINPAEMLGLADDIGTVEAGRVSNLVLLDADPLADIANTRRIQAVVYRGRWLDRAALDGILEAAERRGK